MGSSFSSIKTSRNPDYRKWQEYIAAPETTGCPWVAVEGSRQIRDLASRRPIETLLFSEEGDRTDGLLPLSRRSVRLPARLLGKLSKLHSPPPLLAFFEKPAWRWSDLTPWVLYLDRLQDPGNLGTLLRSAAATGCFSLVTSPGTVSCFNPKVVRSSSAALFSVPFLEGVRARELRRRRFRLLAAVSGAPKPYFSIRYRPPLAFLVGNEGAGIAADLLSAADDRVGIPMAEGTDSLNAGVAGSILMFEVLRQKAGSDD